MSYSEIATLLDTIAVMTEAPDTLDEAVAVNWFKRCLEVHTLVVVAKVQVERDLDAMYTRLIGQYAEAEDARHEAVHAGWGHD